MRSLLRKWKYSRAENPKKGPRTVLLRFLVFCEFQPQHNPDGFTATRNRARATNQTRCRISNYFYQVPNGRQRGVVDKNFFCSKFACLIFRRRTTGNRRTRRTHTRNNDQSDNFSLFSLSCARELQFGQSLAKDKVTTNNSLLINSDATVDIRH